MSVIVQQQEMGCRRNKLGWVPVLLMCAGLSLVGVGCSSSPVPASKELSGADLARMYDRKLIKLTDSSPGTEIEHAKIYIVQDGKKQWVLSDVWIKNHGFAWPEALGNGEVKRLSRQEVDAIPEGPPISTDK